MPIDNSHIRTLESERMTDTPDGGGRRTNRVIPDGEPSGVFPKISRIDAVYGRVNLRKLYPHINTVSVEMYAGAHLIITEAPSNPRIGVLIFSTGSDYHVRADARDRIESYVIAGPESRMVVYGRQLKNASAVLVYQREEEPLPEVGDVYCLSDETGNVIVEQQFVRIQDVAHELRTFNENNVEFRRRVLTLKIGAPLRREFRGISSPSPNSSARGNTLIRSTTVADAARYFGIQPLTEAASKDALEIKVASVFAPIVPTSQREAAVSLATVGGARSFVDIAAANITDGPWELPFTGSGGAPMLVRPSFPIKPGTLKISWPTGGPAYDTEDDGEGAIVPVGGSGWSGTVDYQNRTIQLTQTFSGTGTVLLTYVPQVEVSQAAHNLAIPVTIGTRGTVYVPVLDPLPSPFTAVVQYRALGRWYTLRDLKGDGELVGDDEAYGVALLDFLTGGLNITLGELPDVGSSVIVTWGSSIHYEKRIADSGGKAYQDITLANTPIAPGELDIDYIADGQTYTISADASGVLSGGGASGAINLSTGVGRIEYGTRVPDFDSTLHITYKTWALDPSQGAIGTPVNTKPLTDPTAIGEAILPGTLSGLLAMALTVTVGDMTTTTPATLVPFAVDSVGVVRCTQETGFRNNIVRITLPASTVIGSMNNTSGVITYNPTMLLPAAWYVTGSDHPSWSQGAYLVAAVVSAASVSYTPAEYETEGGASIPAGDAIRVYTDRVEDQDVDDVPVRVDITRTSTAPLVAGSVSFTMSGKTFFERNGTLYIDPQREGAATAAGAINYETGVATPNLWVRGASLALAVNTALIKLGDFSTSVAFFRTSGSPLRPASTYVQATALDGVQLSGTCDANGVIDTTHVHGVVEQSMGVVSVRFGQWLTAAGNEGEPWYDPANVVGSLVFRPRAIQPQTLRYSTVVVSSLPLSADALGLDPVRLPSNGQVQIYRQADVAVLHHTGTHNAGTPAAGSTIDVGREDLESLWLEDANKLRLSTALYAADPDTGIVTMAADASLAGYVTPISAKHRIVQEFQISDVQINGLISLGGPLLRDFPMGSQLSSALMFGDIFARVEHVFDQRTWTGVWSDSLIGDQADVQYNDTDYPIEVLNESAVNERWRLDILTSGGNARLIGENLGVVWTGNIANDIAPVSIQTGKVFMVIRKEGFGLSPWPVLTQLRFNTVSAAPSYWAARVILPGASLEGDAYRSQLRGDSD